MEDLDKTKDQLIKELNQMRRKMAESKPGLAIHPFGREAHIENQEQLPSGHLEASFSNRRVVEDEFGKIIDGSQIQSLMNDFYKLTNIGVAILDLKGKILVATGWQDICTKFHRVHPESLKNCIESDLQLSQGVKKGEYLIYKCRNNMYDMVTPIVVGERHVGNLYLGQFFFADQVPDVEAFSAQAEKWGFDKDKYLEALSRVPRWSRETVDTVMTFYSKFALIIGSLEYSNLNLARTLAELSKAQIGLQQNEQMLRTILSASPVGIGVSQNREMKWVNNAWVKLFGFDNAQECSGLSAQMIYASEEEYNRVGKEIYDGLETGNVTQTDTKFRRTDGSEFDAHIRMQILDTSGPEKVVISAITDISERKRAEEAFRKSEEKYRRIVETANEGVWAMDETHVTTFANNVMAQMLGYTVEEMIGKKVEYFMFDEDLEDHRKKMEVRRQGKSEFYERRFRRKDGTALWTRISATAIMDEESHFRGSFAMFSDLTEIKALESQLIQSQKMETVGTLAAGIAHDFNNMLQVILGYSDMLLMEKEKGEPGYEELHAVIKTCHEARDLVQKIRVFSRKADIQLVPLSLNSQVNDVSKILDHSLPKTIHIDVRLDGGLAPIEADGSLMGQMLMNLAINASEAMPDGGALTIATKNIVLGDDFCRLHAEVKPGPHVMLTVSDTGRGISKELMDKIFEPFFTTKQRDYHRGTGLGLSVVHGIVQQHSGCITVESELGKGTTFRIHLPAVIAEEVPKTPQETLLPIGGTETILLVDDEELVREFSAKVLENFGYKVIAVADGQEALNVYEQERQNISLVILDIIMPRMEGKQCFKALLRLNPSVKVIICTGVAQDDLVREVVALGAKGSVLKPYNMRELLETVREVLDADE